ALYQASQREIFDAEDRIHVVDQAEALHHVVADAKKVSAENVSFEAALGERPADSAQEILKQAPALRVVVVTETPDQELTLELFRRGAHSVVSREIESELFVECLRKVATGEPWLDPQGVKSVLEAYRTHAMRPQSSRTNLQLTPKEALIVSCVTQG